MSFFSKLKKIGKIAAQGVQVVEDARGGNTVAAIGGALDVVKAIQEAAKKSGTAAVAVSNGAAHEDAVKVVAAGVDDHEARIRELEGLILALTGKK